MPDIFDLMMNSTCTILEKSGPDSEGYGQPSQELSQVSGMVDLPCRLSTLSGGKEYRSGKEYSVNSYKIFMRPPTTGQITTRNWMLVTAPSGQVYTLNLLAVNDPSALGHHLEIIGEEVTP